MATVVKRPTPIPRWFWFASMLGCTPGFRRSRCKKLLKVTISRIKLLGGRHEVQVRQLRRDVAQLLQLGQEEKAESRLDRLWKEQSLLSAYIKTGEYCQLVKANLSTIALPRECPMDLKEPIASLCFAASCCADLPELQEFRDILVAKYGKDFLLSGHELLPGKHVNSMFLEAFATKQQSEISRKTLLKGILKEYNVEHPKTPKCPPNHHVQVLACSFSARNSPLKQLSKEEKQQDTEPNESVASKHRHEGLNGEHSHHVEAKKVGYHKQAPKYEHDQVVLGLTETFHNYSLAAPPHDKCSRGRGKQKEHKRISAADEVTAEGNQHFSSKWKLDNNEMESGTFPRLQGHHEERLPENVETKGSGRMSKDKLRLEREMKDSSRGQHDSGENSHLKDCHGCIQEVKLTRAKKEKELLLRARQQKHYDEALSRGSRANAMQQEMDPHYEELNSVEKVAQYGSDNILLEGWVQNNESNFCNRRHSKTNALSVQVIEYDYVKEDARFHSPNRQMHYRGLRPEGDCETQEPCWRESESLANNKEVQKVQRERAYPPSDWLVHHAGNEDAHILQETRKRHGRKHRSTKNLHEVENHSTDNGAISKEAYGDSRETTQPESVAGRCIDDGQVPEEHNIHAKQSRSRRTKKPPRFPSTIDVEAMQETTIEGKVHGKGPMAFGNDSSRREKGPFSELGECRDKERGSQDVAKVKSGGQCSYGINNVSSASYKQRQLINLDDQGESDKGSKNALEVKGGQHSYIVNGARKKQWQPNSNVNDDGDAWFVKEPYGQLDKVSASERKDGQHDSYGVNGARNKQRQPRNNMHDNGDAPFLKEPRVQVDEGSSTLPKCRTFSKPPDRPPPPVPPQRATSFPSRDPPLSPPDLPKRAVSLQTSGQRRGSQEPHVHPKLPDYEDLVASFAALRHMAPR